MKSEDDDVLKTFSADYTHARDARDRLIRRRAEVLAALRRLVEIAQHDSGQALRVARFLLSLYNGWEYEFDLTDLRCLDSKIVDDCLLVLEADARYALGGEVHTFFQDGNSLFQSIRKFQGIKPRRA